MRARWQFYFECEGIRFDRVHEFGALLSDDDAKAFGFPPQAFEAVIRIEPDEESINPTVEQTGKMKITLPGNNESTKDFAIWLAENAAQQVTFSQGRMKISYCLIMGEHLADTVEETEKLGENRFFAEAHLVQVKPPPTFNADALQKVASSPLIQQFTAADSAKNPIDKFLGLFKVLEDLYGPTEKKTTIAEALKGSDELFRTTQQHIYLIREEDREPLTRDAFSRLVDTLVKTRHQCAHLRSKTGFGISHGDPRVKKEVEPLANMIRNVAYEAIQLRS